MGLVQSSGELYRQGEGGDFTWHAPGNFTPENTVVVTCVFWPATGATVNSVTIAGTVADLRVLNDDDSLNWVFQYTAVVEEEDRDDVVFDITGDPYVTGSIEEHSGILAVSPVDAVVDNVSDDGPEVSVSITTLTDDCLIYAGYVDATGQTNITSIAGPPGWTEAFSEKDGTTYEGGSAAFKYAGAAGLETATWTMSGADLNYGRFFAISYKTVGATELVIDPEPGEFRFSGGSANLRAQRRLTAGAGSLQFAGGATSGRVTRSLRADAGDFRFQGGAVGLPLRRVLHADAGQFGFSGNAMALHAQRKLQIAAAEFRVDGQPANFSRSYRIAADAGEFRFVGGPVGFGVDRHIGIDGGEFRFSGGAVDFSVLADGTLNADAGDFRIAGASMSLRASRELQIDTGDFRFAGAEVDTLALRRFPVNSGDFRINGMPMNLIANTQITLGADAGVFGIAGGAVALRIFRHLSVTAAEFRFAGGDVELSRDRVLKADAGSFVFSGQRARLIYSGAPLNTGADRGGISTGISESIWERVA